MEENTVVNNPAEQTTQGDAAQAAAQEQAEVKTPETGVTTEAAAPQEKTSAERFSFALKKRVEEERQKVEAETARKFEGDLRFASEVRRAFQGKGDDDIVSDLISAQARAFAQENGISEGLAREFIELRRAANQGAAPVRKEDPAPATKADDIWLARLAHQRENIKVVYGVDVLEGLSAEDEAAVLRGEMDLNEVFAKFEQAGTPPPVNRGSAGAVKPKPLLDESTSLEEYEAFRARLKREGQIEIRRD